MTISVNSTAFAPSYDSKSVSVTKPYGHKGLPPWFQKAAALAGLIVLSPLLLVVAALIRFESRGDIVFSQVRVGELGRQFKCYKLRSMYIKTDPKFQEPQASDSDRNGVCKKYFNDPRITKVGRIIRKLSIDELPQLWNVVKGDMVLIGPRPHLVSEYEQYDSNILPRLFAKPGMTGLWQVNGRADTDFDEQLELDKTYIREQSIMNDIKILAATVPAVLGAKGAY